MLKKHERVLSGDAVGWLLAREVDTRKSVAVRVQARENDESRERAD